MEQISGIDINVPLPATYVLDAARQVVYDHVDFDAALSTRDIISAVHNSSLAVNLKKSA